MTAPREARTILADLPEVETLSAEEMARIYGAGLARLGLETLESRDMMSANPLSTLSAGVLHIAGSPGVDNVRILQTNSTSFSVEYQLNLHSTPTGMQPSQDIKESWNLNQVKQIDLDGPAGGDRIWMVGSQLPDIFAPIGQQEELAVGGKMNITNASAASVDNLALTQVMQTYNNQGSATKGALGAMTAPECNAPGGGRIARFEHGAIIYNSFGTFTLSGAIGDEYIATAKEKTVTDPSTNVQDYLGKIQSLSSSVAQFDNGAIYYSKTTGAHVVYGDINARYQQMSQTLGLPTNDGISVGSNTLAVSFQNGYLTWMKTAPGVNGIHAVLGNSSATGSMGEEYSETHGWLGAATGDQQTLAGTNYTIQNFQHGVIFSANAGHDAVSVDNAAWNFYVKLSPVQQSTLGIPVDDSANGAVSGMRVTPFSHGALLQFQGQVYMMNGPMWNYYKSLANQTDPTTGKLYQVEIGAPVQNTLTNANGSTGSMLFQFGSLVYNTTGGHIMAGPIYTEYLKTASMKTAGGQIVQNVLGAQLSSIQPAPAANTYEVVFQGGVITWSKTGGAHVTLM